MKRRFPKRIWLVNNKAQRQDHAEVVRSAKTAAFYRDDPDMQRWGWEVAEYVKAAPVSSPAPVDHRRASA